MKKLQTIGKVLTKSEQRSITGGYEPGVADAQCIFTYDTSPQCATSPPIDTLYDCTDPDQVSQMLDYGKTACQSDPCCLTWDCFSCFQ